MSWIPSRWLFNYTDDERDRGWQAMMMAMIFIMMIIIMTMMIRWRWRYGYDDDDEDNYDNSDETKIAHEPSVVSRTTREQHQISTKFVEPRKSANHYTLTIRSLTTVKLRVRLFSAYSSSQPSSYLSVDPLGSFRRLLHSPIEVNWNAVLRTRFFPRIAKFQPIVRLLHLEKSTYINPQLVSTSTLVQYNFNIYIAPFWDICSETLSVLIIMIIIMPLGLIHVVITYAKFHIFFYILWTPPQCVRINKLFVLNIVSKTTQRFWVVFCASQ